MCVYTCAGALDNQKRASDWHLEQPDRIPVIFRSWVPLILEAERPHCNHWAIFLAPGILWLAFALCCFAFWLCVAHAGLELTWTHASPKLSVIPLLQPSQWLSYRSVFTTPSLASFVHFQKWIGYPPVGLFRQHLCSVSLYQSHGSVCKVSLKSCTYVSAQWFQWF